ncbi:transcription intermediary factor 1-alpha-like [Labrus mixtus]|uniref:transcription intermediary factor 1-alpha-like n=1 Tax=Labrus mixtus TaxID=508554 RepID=UPI0029BFC5BE|nr:transcription intermediary factor 1-alpha-like [Labrus mixtus]
MAHLPSRSHSNFPQRRTTLFPEVARCRVTLTLEAESWETGSHPATTAEEPSLPAEQLCTSGSCVIKNESCNGKITTASPSSEKQQKLSALLKRLRIHPEAQRILGTSCIPVVSLERLNLQSVSLSCLQPVVSLVRLPCQTRAKIHNDVSCLRHPPQTGFSENEDDSLDITEASLQSKPAESSDFSRPESSSWTEPYCPDSSPSEGPEQDSGFDCESNPDQPYILFESASEEWDLDVNIDSETFYLDPDPEQTLVIELDPEPEMDQDQSLELEDEPETNCEVDEVQMEISDDQTPDQCCSQGGGDSCIQQPGPGSGPEEMESDDFCAVCLNGGDLLCCDHCPKVYHLACHIPPLISFPLGDWVCSLCRTDQDPEVTYDCEDTHSCGGVRAPYTLSNQDQRRCVKLTLLLYCHTLSAPFHEPVSPLARNYYQIIKRPIDLSVIRRKLDKSNTLHYFTPEQFVDDVLLMFKNCSTFNYPDSEVAQAGRNLELFFLSKLREIFPDQTFLSACRDRTDGARLQWLRRRRKENYKSHVSSGKKYLL